MHPPLTPFKRSDVTIPLRNFDLRKGFDISQEIWQIRRLGITRVNKNQVANLTNRERMSYAIKHFLLSPL